MKIQLRKGRRPTANGKGRQPTAEGKGRRLAGGCQQMDADKKGSTKGNSADSPET